MKKHLLLICSFCLTFTAWAQQELYDEQNFSIDFGDSRPVFSMLATDIFGGEFSLPKVDLFRPEIKKEVNMVALMEKERQFKERKIDFDSPLLRKNKESGKFKISERVHLYSFDHNYDPYTGKKKNSVYEEMRPHLFNNVYRSYYARRNSYYSPYFR